MQELLNHIARIQDKLGMLQKQFLQIQRENERLLLQHKSYVEKDQLQQQRLEELQQQLDVLKATRGGKIDEGDKQALEKRINQYLREIDKCIALLNE